MADSRLLGLAARPVGSAPPARQIGVGGEPRAAQILRRLDQYLWDPEAGSVTNDEGVHEQLEHAAIGGGLKLPFAEETTSPGMAEGRVAGRG